MLLRALRSLFGGGQKAPDPAPASQPAPVSSPYNPGIFTVNSIEQARAVTLPPEGGTTTAERWENETRYLAGALDEALPLNDGSVVLDYGCGMGRMSKVMIERHRCSVIGVDISPSMRQMALAHVKHEKFSAVSPEDFTQSVERGTQVDCAIAIWVLQHCPTAGADVALIKKALKKGGLFYVLNNENSAVPTYRGWFNDGVKIRQILEKEFTLVRYSRLPYDATVKLIADNTFIGLYRNDKA